MGVTGGLVGGDVVVFGNDRIDGARKMIESFACGSLLEAVLDARESLLHVGEHLHELGVVLGECLGAFIEYLRMCIENLGVLIKLF